MKLYSINWVLPAAITQKLVSYFGMDYTDLVSVCLPFYGVFLPWCVKDCRNESPLLDKLYFIKSCVMS